ncbi:hypothetical protein HYW21_06835 [Candidatus Woesearchaeota archaeon]|nr:hypothetical protein [Candidatus Woesearchaeota archaeon]
MTPKKTKENKNEKEEDVIGTAGHQEKEGKKNTDKDEIIEQLFALRIHKTIDPTTKKVNIEVKAASQKLPLPEVLLILEGWVTKQKEAMINNLFGKNDGKDDKRS